jgi:hypothetical protein
MKATAKTKTQEMKNKLLDFLKFYYQLHNGVMFMK